MCHLSLFIFYLLSCLHINSLRKYLFGLSNFTLGSNYLEESNVGPLKTLRAESTASEEVSTGPRQGLLPSSSSVLSPAQWACRGGGGGVGLTGSAGLGGSAGFNGESGGSEGMDDAGTGGRGCSSFWSRRIPYKAYHK